MWGTFKNIGIGCVENEAATTLALFSRVVCLYFSIDFYMPILI